MTTIPRTIESPSRDRHACALRLRTHLALYAAAAALLFVVESWIPNPFPWLRLGLANIVTLVVLIQHGTVPAAAVFALRLLLGGFFAGTLFAPQFLLALSGGLASLLSMSLAHRLAPMSLSPLGLSVVGAGAHAAGQLAAVAVVLRAGAGVFTFLPLFLGLSLVTGALIGVLADLLLARIELPAR